MTTPLAIITAMFNTLWQAAALTCFVWLALRRTRTNAATRYVIWWAVLATVLLLPGARQFAVWFGQPHDVPAIALRSHPVPAAAVFSLPAEADPPAAIVTFPEQRAARWPLVIFGLWTAVVLYKLARIGQSYLHLRGLKRNSTLSALTLPETGRRARVLVSRSIVSPMAVGFLDAAVILPKNLLGQVSADELDQILLHEAAHLSRRDDWLNLLARVLGAILALHPVAWWVLRQIDNEREAACDDWVVARTGAVTPYAETLAHMVELRWQGIDAPREALASGVFGRGSRVGDRIEMLLLSGRGFSARVSIQRAAVAVLTLCCLAVAGSFAPSWIAFAKISSKLRPSVPSPVTQPLVSEQNAMKPVLVAQRAADAPAPQVSAPAKEPAPAFEVASIRPTVFSDANFQAGFYAGASGNPCQTGKLTISGTRVSLTNAGICDLIRIAYGIKPYEIVGAPALPKVSGIQAAGPSPLPQVPGVQGAYALAEAHAAFFYDIEARVPGTGTPTDDQVDSMLRALLAERFQLKMHRDTRELSFYALVIAKGGAKLTPAKDDCQPKGNKMSVSGQGRPMMASTHVCNRSMDQIARDIGGRADRPVLDKTGLTGNFDYDLQVEFSTADDLNSAYLEAYQKQLGLSLESRKGPVDVLVVDRVEAPSGN